MSGRHSVPIEVERVAAAGGLGEVRGSHRALYRVLAPGDEQRAKRADARNAVLVLLAAALPLLTALLLWWATGRAGLAIGVGAAIALTGAGAVWAVAAKKGKDQVSRVYLYSEGFLLLDGATNTGRAFRWDDFPAVHRSSTDTFVSGQHIGTDHTFRLVGVDGTTVVLRGFEAQKNPLPTDIVELGPLLEEEIANRRLPLAVEAINAGGEVRFGDLSLSASGIGTPRGHLPWGGVGPLSTSAGHLLLGTGRPAKYPVAAIPNFALFLFLARNLDTTR
ncbi:DUF6585 family protein [Actinosynnema sp. NPDC050436]|uniref:DUF6585 family protein n=1 Tax=Actinosynnema sp. NPDC050436 TaxID=3155659 RepID=UPI0033E52EB2